MKWSVLGVLREISVILLRRHGSSMIHGVWAFSIIYPEVGGGRLPGGGRFHGRIR